MTVGGAAPGWRGLGLLALLTLAAYATALVLPFSIWDDPVYVLNNPRVKDATAAGLASVWSSQWAYAGRFVEYHPLRDTVYWALYRSFGPNPLPFHAASVVAHFVASLLVASLARRVGLSRSAALGAAAVFAVHPIHVESVTWVSGLKDPLYFAFMTASLLAWIEHRRARRPGALVLSMLLLVCGLLCKGLAIVTPGLMLAWHLAFGAQEAPPAGSPRLPVALSLAGPVLVVLLFTAQLMAIARTNNAVTPSWHGGSVTAHCFLSAWAFVLYVWKSLAPTSFRPVYCFAPISGATDPRLWAAALVPAAYVAAVLWSWRRHRLGFFLLAWFVVCLVPVMNLVPTSVIFADRYSYASSFASSSAIALLCERLGPSVGRRVLGALVVSMAVVVAVRNLDWRHESVLWEEVVADPACANETEPMLTLASAYLRERRYADGLVWLERATRHPNFQIRTDAQVVSAHVNAARAATVLGLRAVAIRHAQAAVRTDPTLEVTWAELWQAQWAAGDLRSALATAEMAFARDRRSSLHRWGRALLGLELTPDSGTAAAELAAVVAAEPSRWCGGLVEWKRSHPPGHPARGAVDAAWAGAGCGPS